MDGAVGLAFNSVVLAENCVGDPGHDTVSQKPKSVMDVPVAANVLGTIGAICWSVQLIPQIVINYRRHDTTGLQPTMMLLWACAGVPLGVYNIVEDFNVALKIQPQILTFLSLVTWAQCKYYGNKWTVIKVGTISGPVMLVMAGVECALVFALRAGQKSGVEWPVIMMAVLSACFLCAGVLRHYWDIYQERTVRGISFIFVFLDALGDLTSLISVCFEPKLDVLGMVIYGSELLLWCGVFACGGYYNLRPWYHRQLQARSSSYMGDHITETVDNVAQETTATASSSTSSVFRTASNNSNPVIDERSTQLHDPVRLRTIHSS